VLSALPDRNKAVIRRLTRELFNDDGDAFAARALLAPGFADRTCPPGADPGREAYVRRAIDLRRAVTGLRTRSEQLVGEGDMVSERSRRTFRQSGLPAEAIGFAQYRLRHGRVVEAWSQSQAVGAPPATGDLTPREMRVALLVAEGRTNPEVGVELALSRKTVECHLSQIYRKLGLRSRIDLARVLAPVPQPRQSA
jgi:DNA-binding CsgD family transcriptional regulator